MSRDLGRIADDFHDLGHKIGGDGRTEQPRKGKGVLAEENAGGEVVELGRIRDHAQKDHGPLAGGLPVCHLFVRRCRVARVLAIGLRAERDERITHFHCREYFFRDACSSRHVYDVELDPEVCQKFLEHIRFSHWPTVDESH